MNEVLTRLNTGLDAASKRQECPYMASYSTHLPKWRFEFTNQKAGFVYTPTMATITLHAYHKS